MGEPDDAYVELQRIRLVFQQLPLTLLVAVLNAVLTMAVLAPVAGNMFLGVWLALILALSAARLAAWHRFSRTVRDGAVRRSWCIVTFAGSLATGVLWGSVSTQLPHVAETYQLFFAFVVGGMCAGTTAVNSAYAPAALAFIVAAALPLASSFLVDPSEPRLVSAVMIVVFAAALSLTSLRAHRAFGERVRLQLALSRQGQALREANEKLRNEMADRREAEDNLQQAQKMEAIGHLTGGIAHDFNNLLHVVMGNLSIVGRLAGENARIQEHLLAAEQAVSRAARLTNSLLAFARRQALQMETVSVNALLEEFQPILTRAIGKDINLTTSLMDDLPLCRTDRAHFQSAILNLVINARDAMPEGGQLSIRTGVATLAPEDLLTNPDARPGRFVCTSVQDTGVGMTDAVMAKAFEPFFTTKAVGKGSGLGLSQAYGFARQSGGHVVLHSTLGQGSRVSLYLPSVA